MTAEPMGPAIGVIADDLTGGSDIASTLAAAGARTVLAAGIPETIDAGADACVIALKTRSCPPGEAVRQSLAALDALLAAGCRQIVFKVCSTFDSTPQGNIGPVAAALLGALQADRTLVCPAFPENGRTLYQGHLFVGDRLISETGMVRHPLTPMTDPDLRRWLSMQTDLRVGLLALDEVRGGDGGAARRIAALAADKTPLILADAVSDEDLHALGRLAAQHRLVIGGSGIARGLPANFGIEPRRAAFADAKEIGGDGLILSGSCSEATLAQIKAWSAHGPVLRLFRDDIDEKELDAERDVAAALEFAARHKGAFSLIATSAGPQTVSRLQVRHGRERIAAHCENVLAETAARAIADGARRIIAAGGETSGAVCARLGPLVWRIGAAVAPGVPLLVRAQSAAGHPPMALILKSGNFGGADFFSKAVSAMERAQ